MDIHKEIIKTISLYNYLTKKTRITNATWTISNIPIDEFSSFVAESNNLVKDKSSSAFLKEIDFQDKKLVFLYPWSYPCEYFKIGCCIVLETVSVKIKSTVEVMEDVRENLQDS